MTSSKPQECFQHSVPSSSLALETKIRSSFLIMFAFEMSTNTPVNIRINWLAASASHHSQMRSDHCERKEGIANGAQSAAAAQGDFNVHIVSELTCHLSSRPNSLSISRGSTSRTKRFRLFGRLWKPLFAQTSKRAFARTMHFCSALQLKLLNQSIPTLPTNSPRTIQPSQHFGRHSSLATGLVE